MERFLKTVKTLFLLILVPAAIFLAINFVGNILLIGEKIGSITWKWVECVFDIVFIFIPLILLAHAFHKNFRKYKHVSLRNSLESRDSQQLDEVLKIIGEKETKSTEDESQKFHINLRYAFNKSISEKREIIKDYINHCEKLSKDSATNIAILAGVSVVISPQSTGDTLCLLFWNCRAINETLRIYGFRPRGMQLIRLYCEVLFSSLLAGSVDELMESIASVGTNIPFVGAAAQATAAIYSILRTTKMTRFLIENGVSGDNCKKAKKEAISFALLETPKITLKVVEKTGGFVGEGIKKIFGKQKNDDTTEADEQNA